MGPQSALKISSFGSVTRVGGSSVSHPTHPCNPGKLLSPSESQFPHPYNMD